jgi:hypothetical protein
LPSRRDFYVAVETAGRNNGCTLKNCKEAFMKGKDTANNFCLIHIIKKIFFIMFFPLFLCACVSSEETAGNEIPQKEPYHTVTFLAYGPGTIVDRKISIAGHALLSINHSGVWSFYPSTPEKLHTEQGLLKYNAEFPPQYDSVDFKVDQNTMNEIMRLIHQWENAPPAFSIPDNDCVSFIYRVCDIIGLYYNSITLMPASAIIEIRVHNDQRRIYGNL